MSKIIGDEPCPSCRSQGRDKSGDHLINFENGGKHCTRCGYTEGNGKNKGGDERVQSFEDLLTGTGQEPPSKEEKKKVSPSIQGKGEGLKGPYRGIDKDVYNKAGVQGIYSGKNLVALEHTVYEVGGSSLAKKQRKLPKDFFVVGSTKGKKVELFNQRNCSKSKKLIICEGELDCLSILQAFRGTKYNPPSVVSLPFGANTKSLLDNQGFISQYPELIICGDGDDAGEKFKQEVASLYPKAKFMELSGKDANEVLEFGKKQDLLTAVYNADMYKPPFLVNISSIAQSIATPIEMGLLTPWPSVDKITYGLMKHSIISIGAGPSVGKTEFIRALMQHIMMVHKEMVGIISLEEGPEAVLRALTGYIMGQRINLPNAKYNGQDAVKVALSLENKALIYDHKYFNRKWENMMVGLRMFCALGARVLFVDPVSSLVTGQDSSDANTQLGIIMDDMAQLVTEMPVTIVMVNHLNDPPRGNKQYSEGTKPKPEAFTGSRAQHRYSHYMLGLSRNTTSQDQDEKNTLCVQNIKCRINGGLQGNNAYLSYSQNTGNFEEQVMNTGGFV